MRRAAIFSIITLTAVLSVVTPTIALAQDAQPPPPQSALLTLFMQYILPGLVTVGGPLILWALTSLSGFLKAKAGESKVFGVLSVVTEAANSVVAELNVTLKPQLQAALADGVLTDDEKRQLKKAALDILKHKLPAATLASAQGMFGPLLDTWLGGLVERAVIDQKPAPVKSLEEAAAVLRGPVPA